MQVAGRGQIGIWEGGSLWLLRAESARGQTDFHTHHAIQLTFSLEGSMEIWTPTQHLKAPAVAVAADARHRFEATGSVAFLFVEPESAAGLALGQRLFAPSSLASIETEELEDILAELRDWSTTGRRSAADIERMGEAIIRRVSCTCSIGALDHRVQAMIEYAAANLDQPLSLAAATASIGLSPSRLRHLFVEQTGLAFKTYVLWLRIRRALECYASGATLTEAAHAAAFSDSAHLSRTFRRTFGVSAASLKLLSTR